MTNDQIWQAVLGELELTLSKANFITWFKSTFIANKNEGEYVIGVPNAFTREWLQNKYHKNISRALQSITSDRITKIDYEIHNHKPAAPQNLIQDIGKKPSGQPVQPVVELKEQQPTVAAPENKKLNPRYLFENFVVGSNNELAHAAAKAVSKSPGTTYNPLFIYGGVGLGKTHLIQAIGNILLNEQNKKIVYVTCEEFTDDFINYIQKGKNSESVFKDRYRQCDVLLIDDIQFLSGKERTQEEFFHTFNSLYQSNKQIVLTSDRPPKAISSLEDRLVSRFEGGMIADIGLPDLETRKVIIERKCNEKGITMPDEVLSFIASNIQHNIRELEGALSTVVAHCQLHNVNPTEEIAKSVLSNILTNPNKKAITPKHIISIISNFYDVQISELLAKNRKKEIAWPRQIAMFLMREEGKSSYPSIGRELGGRDHTTAIHAYEKVNKEVSKNDDLRQEIEIIKQKLYMPR